MSFSFLKIFDLSHVINFIFSKPVLLLVYVLFIAFYLFLSFILTYHWHSYVMKSQGILVVESLFIFVSLILFIIAGVSISYF